MFSLPTMGRPLLDLRWVGSHITFVVVTPVRLFPFCVTHIYTSSPPGTRKVEINLKKRKKAHLPSEFRFILKSDLWDHLQPDINILAEYTAVSSVSHLWPQPQEITSSHINIVLCYILLLFYHLSFTLIIDIGPSGSLLSGMIVDVSDSPHDRCDQCFDQFCHPLGKPRGTVSLCQGHSLH